MQHFTRAFTQAALEATNEAAQDARQGKCWPSELRKAISDTRAALEAACQEKRGPELREAIPVTVQGLNDNDLSEGRGSASASSADKPDNRLGRLEVEVRLGRLEVEVSFALLKPNDSGYRLTKYMKLPEELKTFARDIIIALARSNLLTTKNYNLILANLRNIPLCAFHIVSAYANKTLSEKLFRILLTNPYSSNVAAPASYDSLSYLAEEQSILHREDIKNSTYPRFIGRMRIASEFASIYIYGWTRSTEKLARPEVIQRPGYPLGIWFSLRARKGISRPGYLLGVDFPLLARPAVPSLEQRSEPTHVATP